MTLAKPPKRFPKARKPIKRTSRPARVRKSASGKAKHSLNRLWSQAVMAKGPVCLLRLDWRCTVRAVDPAHLWPKSVYPSIRHLLDVGVPACRVCHNAFDSGSLALRAAVKNRLIGASRVLELFALASQPSPDRDEVRATLTAAIAKAQKGPKGN